MLINDISIMDEKLQNSSMEHIQNTKAMVHYAFLKKIVGDVKLIFATTPMDFRRLNDQWRHSPSNKISHNFKSPKSAGFVFMDNNIVCGYFQFKQHYEGKLFTSDDMTDDFNQLMETLVQNGYVYNDSYSVYDNWMIK